MAGEKFFVQQRRERERAHAGAALLKEFTAGDKLQTFERLHGYSLVKVSSRFNRTFAVIVHAAS